MKNESGFTLIELVAVIIILGILSATAIPKYMDLRSEAQIATVQALRGAIESGDQMIYAKAITQREHKKQVGVMCKQQTTAYNTGCTAGTDGFNVRYGHIFGSFDPIINVLDDDEGIVETDSLAATVKCPNDWCVQAWRDSVTGYSRTANEVSSGSKIAKLIPRGYAFNEECGVVVMKNFNNIEKPKILALTKC